MVHDTTPVIGDGPPVVQMFFRSEQRSDGNVPLNAAGTVSRYVVDFRIVATALAAHAVRRIGPRCRPASQAGHILLFERHLSQTHCTPPFPVELIP